METCLPKSIWSDPTAAPAGEDPISTHVDSISAWLRIAGAEPRLWVVLCSGPAAKTRFAWALSRNKIDLVEAPATASAPVHPKLAAHRGDHFNRTLFWVDGLSGADSAELWAALAAQISSIKRTATWVALVVESLESLQHFDTASGGALRRGVHRWCLALDGTDLDRVSGAPPDPNALARWDAHQAVAPLVYQHFMTPSAAPRYADFSRLVRSGFAGTIPADLADLHPDRRALIDLWRDRTTQAPADIGPAAAEAWMRHAPDGTAGADCAAALSDDPAARYVVGLPVDDTPLLAELAAIRGGATPNDPAALRATARRLEVGVNLRIELELVLATAAADREDMEAVEHCLSIAAHLATEAVGVSPEVDFEVTEKNAQLHAFARRPTPARLGIDRLRVLAPILLSPFYEARVELARGELIAPIDRSLAAGHLDRARTLFARAGYADWAAIAGDAHAQCRGD